MYQFHKMTAIVAAVNVIPDVSTLNKFSSSDRFSYANFNLLFFTARNMTVQSLDLEIPSFEMGDEEMK